MKFINYPYFIVHRYTDHTRTLKRELKVHRIRICMYGCCISLQFQNLSSCRLSRLSFWFQLSQQTRLGSPVTQAKAFGDSLWEAFFVCWWGGQHARSFKILRYFEFLETFLKSNFFCFRYRRMFFRSPVWQQCNMLQYRWILHVHMQQRLHGGWTNLSRYESLNKYWML